MSELETWYVLETGDVADPAEVTADDAGVLRHRGGLAVAMRGDVPRSRSVDPSAHRQMRPVPTGPGYVTRAAGPPEAVKPADDPALAAARGEYHAAFGRRPFAGWDAAVLSQKIAAKAG